MRRLLLVLAIVPGCFADAPPVDDVTAEESSSDGGSSDGESEDGSETEGESSSTGAALVPLYGACEWSEDCEGGVAEHLVGSSGTGVACIASTCLAWHYGKGEHALEPCAVNEVALNALDEWELCAVAADISTGLAECPDAMATAVWEGDAATTATCWNAALVSGATCTTDDQCGGDTHCMGQPWYTNGELVKLPNVCR